MKPLRPYFSRMHRTLLVDDDAHKAVAGEEKNMLLMPCWDKDDPRDNMVGVAAHRLHVAMPSLVLHHARGCPSSSPYPRPSLAQVEHLVEVLLSMAEAVAGEPEADVREFTAHASQQLQARAAEERARLAAVPA